ncbi:DmsC/YnfH family molybdoenzyme membrane anchor subunit [Pelagicoccus albus]|uniref:Dimethyl sulfoxide reductase anchor subunit n=1 Tax=Pelagicoccus albus TaxID=415222 RepID=A0A7X1B303_9BACT|nr:DmsC/YnfH family molybdoenzyme membrane anchor subunit [Pelagicoccus albus]MBC2604577.1 dimethyl sulfoxide reductase anchor subunit [Pelagicoccus albus]
MSELIDLKDKTLIDMLLEEQQQVGTPVGRFADAAESESGGQGGRFGDLIPLSAPRKGEQYAFQVDLDRCSGCKGCVTACHSLNGLDEDETWRDIGSLVGEGEQGPYLQTVTTACHHCVEPGCLIGCPVNAYEKDEASGIVLHLDDQCIGCQYCVLKCPYDVPKYSSKRGVVRKCDMCHSRLSSGEAPACVQACPHEAIKIVTVETNEVLAKSSRGGGFLPASPDPSYTKPSTSYISSKKLPDNLVAADAHVLRPQHTHWPLVGLLALSQIGIGGFLASAFSWERGGDIAYAIAWGVLHVGLLCSALHLGQPLKAWRIFVGFRRSWLSREAVVLGFCSGISIPALGAICLGWFGFSDYAAAVGPWGKVAAWASALVGLIGVLTSVFIYVDTQRSFWRLRISAFKFYGSVVLGALSFAAIAAGGVGLFEVLSINLVLALKLFGEWKSLHENAVTVRLVEGPLSTIWKLRLFSAAVVAATVVLGYFLGGLWLALVGLASVCLSELLERVLYFKAVNAPKMPGGHNG